MATDTAKRNRRASKAPVAALVPAAGRMVSRSDNQPTDAGMVMSLDTVKSFVTDSFKAADQADKYALSGVGYMAAALFGYHAYMVASTMPVARLSTMDTNNKAKSAFLNEFRKQYLPEALVTADKRRNTVGDKAFVATDKAIRAHNTQISRGMDLVILLTKAGCSFASFDTKTKVWNVPLRATAPFGVTLSADQTTAIVPLDGRMYGAAGKAANGNPKFTTWFASVAAMQKAGKPPKTTGTSTGSATSQRAVQNAGDNASKAFGGVNLNTLSVTKLIGTNGLHIEKTIDVFVKQWSDFVKDAHGPITIHTLGKDRWNALTTALRQANQFTQREDFAAPLPAQQAS